MSAQVQVDAAVLFGILTVASMLVSYALKPNRTGFFIAFAVSWILGSAYLFYEGARLIGAVQGIFAILALDRWRRFIRRRK